MIHGSGSVSCPFALPAGAPWCGVLEVLGHDELLRAFAGRTQRPRCCASGAHIRCGIFERVDRQLERANRTLRGPAEPERRCA